jgi:hypothetical protein
MPVESYTMGKYDAMYLALSHFLVLISCLFAAIYISLLLLPGKMAWICIWRWLLVHCYHRLLLSRSMYAHRGVGGYGLECNDYGVCALRYFIIYLVAHLAASSVAFIRCF